MRLPAGRRCCGRKPAAAFLQSPDIAMSLIQTLCRKQDTMLSLIFKGFSKKSGCRLPSAASSSGRQTQSTLGIGKRKSVCGAS